MDTTNKKMTYFINIVNQSTREYLNILLNDQTSNPKFLMKIQVHKAFDDMNLQTKSHDLDSFQRNFILQINYFNRNAVLRWLQVKNSLNMGNTLDKKDINIVFDQVAESVLKYTDLSDEKLATFGKTHNTKV